MNNKLTHRYTDTQTQTHTDTTHVHLAGGGVDPETEERMWTFSFQPRNIKATEQRLRDLSSTTTLRGLGVGLPMSRLYAQFVGGALDGECCQDP